MKKPSRKGPWWGLAISSFVFVEAFIDAFIDREEDALEALKFLAISLMFLTLSWWWMERRLKALDAWKEERELEWWLKDLPEEQ